MKLYIQILAVLLLVSNPTWAQRSKSQKPVQENSEYWSLVEGGEELLSRVNYSTYAEKNKTLTSVKPSYYASEADVKEFERSYEKFKASIGDERLSDAGREAALNDYMRSMDKFKNATENSGSRRSNAYSVDYKIKQAKTAQSSIQQSRPLSNDVAAAPSSAGQSTSGGTLQTPGGLTVSSGTGTQAGAKNTEQKPKASEKDPSTAWRFQSDEDKAKVFKETLEKNTARCFFAGFRGYDSKGKCRPASDDPAKIKEQSGDFAKGNNMKCGKDMIPCNPLLFGLGENGKAICVPRVEDATKRCQNSSLLKPKCSDEEAAKPSEKARCEKINKAHAEYLKIMDPSGKDNASKRALSELHRSIRSSCGDEQLERSKKLQITNAQRKNHDDFNKTCEIMSAQIEYVNKNILWTQEKGSQRTNPIMNSQELDAGIK